MDLISIAISFLCWKTKMKIYYENVWIRNMNTQNAHEQKYCWIKCGAKENSVREIYSFCWNHTKGYRVHFKILDERIWSSVKCSKFKIYPLLSDLLCFFLSIISPIFLFCLMVFSRRKMKAQEYICWAIYVALLYPFIFVDVLNFSNFKPWKISKYEKERKQECRKKQQKKNMRINESENVYKKTWRGYNEMRWRED